MKIPGKVAIVTGGAAGIGRAHVEALLEKCAKVSGQYKPAQNTLHRLRHVPVDVRNDVMETCEIGIPYLGLGLGIRPRIRV